MDNVEDIKLFDNDLKEVALPSQNLNMTKEIEQMKSPDISKAISGETVNKIIVPEGTDVAELNYIVDVRKISINLFQKEALKSLVRKDGEVVIYFYTKQGLVEVGKGDKYELEKTVPLVKKFVFNDEITIYKNFKLGEEPEEVTSSDITKLRLHL